MWLAIIFGLVICSVQTFSVDPALIQRDSYSLVGGSNLTLPCKEGDQKDQHIHTLIWFCRGCDGVGAAVKEKARFDSDGFFIDAATSRISWMQDNFSLVLGGLDPADSGEWFCTVNGRNQYLNTHSLIVKDVPSTPGRPLIMSFSSRTVNLSWAPPLDNHNAPVTHYIIRQRMGEDSSWEATRDLRTSDNKTVFSVHGLQPFTVYSFKVIAVNELGESEKGIESYYMITLREPPSGKPTIIEAGNSSSASIFLSWHPPHPDTLHGEFLGYRLNYKLRKEGALPVSIQLKDPGIREYTVQGLRTFSQYLVSLQVINPEGEGPKSTVVVMTDEGIPSAPEEVRCENVTSSSVMVSWGAPLQPNGIILGYRLYYMHTNFTDVQTIRESGVQSEREHKVRIEYNLTGLDVYTTYRIWVKAFTWRNEGSSSSQFPVQTDLRGPSAPSIQNLTCLDDTSVFLEWCNADAFHVEFYYVYFKEEGEKEFHEITVENKTSNNSYKIILENLTEDASYWIKLRGFSRSIVTPHLLYGGEWGEPRNLLMRGGCQIAKAYTVIHSRHLALNLNAGVIAGLGVTVLLVAVALLSVAMWRRYWRESYYYLEETNSNTGAPTPPDWDIKSAVPAHLFSQYVQKMRSTTFTKEFEGLNLEGARDNPSTRSLLPANRDFNRYNNVLAYDSSLVQLKPLLGAKEGGYINANYVDGFQRARAYIATQGPMQNTVADFWRMVWEQRAEVIVMITNIIEQGKDKCYQYWPVCGSELFGLMKVTLNAEIVLATHTIRTFRLEHSKLKGRGGRGGACRTVVQYQYTSWPDHGVPPNPLPLLSFIKKSSNTKDSNGPIVVHCSAGVGRSGAYIVIDAMLKQLKAKGELSIIPFLNHIRNQRNFMVQTLEQFTFIHDAIAETVLSGETNIKISYLPRYITSLQATFTTEESNTPFMLMDRQFSHVTRYKPQECEFSSAILPVNQLKNQSFDFIPLESNRVCLSVMSGVEGSDYINATWLPGYFSLTQFILTQHPKESTSGDLWRMVWEQSVKTIIVLSGVQEPELPVFWPVEQQRSGSIIVAPTEEGLLAGFQTKDFSLRMHNESSTMKVRLIFCPEWGRADHFMMLGLLGVVNALPPATTIVMDALGGAQAGSLCALSHLLNQARAEGHVDVYQAAKTLHNSRPGIWTSSDTLLDLYKATLSYTASLENRGNPDGTDKTHTNKF